jgi:hypothetical protein
VVILRFTVACAVSLAIATGIDMSNKGRAGYGMMTFAVSTVAYPESKRANEAAAGIILIRICAMLAITTITNSSGHGQRICGAKANMGGVSADFQPSTKPAALIYVTDA